jgi:hypothetical protein
MTANNVRHPRTFEARFDALDGGISDPFIFAERAVRREVVGLARPSRELDTVAPWG